MNKCERSTWIYCTLLVVWGILTGLLYYCIYFFGLKGADVNPFAWVVYFGTLMIVLWPVLLFFVLILTSLSQRKSLKNGNFFVIKDEVIYKEEKDIFRRGHVYTEKNLHFQKCGDVKVNSTYYEITSEGDIFYMVVYSKDSVAPQKYYPVKIYEYVEQ